MEGELLLYALFESTPFLKRQRVRLRNDWDDVDNIGKLLQNDNVDRLQSMSRRLDEEEAAVDAGVLDIAFTLGGELFSQVGRVLVFDVFDDWIPAIRIRLLGQETGSGRMTDHLSLLT